MTINGRAKGAGGEREAAQWLQKEFKLEITPQRNLEQVRSGGADLIGFAPFQIEVKRAEGEAKRKWWLQVTQACDINEVPVVMYRRNRQPWRFLISARNIGVETGFMQLEAREFILWAKGLLS